MTRATRGIVTIAAAAIVASAVAFAGVTPQSATPRGRSEQLELLGVTATKLRALAEAKQAGTFGRAEAITGRAAPGWAGERVVSGVIDDWEPAVAADPVDPYAYILTTRFGYPKPCSGNCPIPHISLTISDDGGRTWGSPRPLCACKGSWQYDPIIEVVPNTGHVYAVYLNGFNVVFVRSTNHGRTWSDPVPTWGNVSWNDKPALATDASGRHIYLSWNGPTGGDPWIAQSHDFGATWTQTKVVDSDRYFFAYDGVVLDDGTAVISQSSFSYSGPAAAAEGVVRQHLFISHDRGRTWRNVVLDSLQLGPPCTTEGCYADFHLGHSGVSADADDDLVAVYDGALTPGGPQQSFARRSTDGGRTWSARVLLSIPGQNTIAPTVEVIGNGDARTWFAVQNGTGRWNTFFRRSTDGGVTWGARVKISDAITGAQYKNANGFLEFYGDYGEIAITSEGKTIGVWGEAFSNNGPGGVWFNRQT